MLTCIVMSFQGYHPKLADAWQADKLQALRRLADNPSCVAIGECGLDFLSGKDNADKQVALFKLQVNTSTLIFLNLDRTKQCANVQHHFPLIKQQTDRQLSNERMVKISELI